MRYVIIGAEAAGMSAAAKARRTDVHAEVIVYEKSDVVSFGACGLPYYVGDYFDDTRYMVSRTAEQAKESGIKVNVRHQVLAVNAALKEITVKNLVSDKTFIQSYDKLMVATGASPIIPPIENLHVDNVFTLKTMSDGTSIKMAAQTKECHQVVIIGAGYIGLEAAEAMRKMGKQVRIIQLAARVLPDSFDKEITDLIEQELASHDVALHLAETVLRIQGSQCVTGVETNKGHYPADMVIICTGVKPNTDFLASTGIECLPNGAIKINAFGETNLPDIYAAGDCASVFHLVKQTDTYIPLATTANRIGRIVGENMAGHRSGFPGTLGTAAVKVLDLAAGRTGITEEDAQKAGLQFKTVFVRDKDHSNYLPGQADIFVKLIYDTASRRLLGGQIAGRGSSILRIDALAAAITGGLTIEQLGMLDFFYAPPFSRPWDVLNIAANAAK